MTKLDSLFEALCFNPLTGEFRWKIATCNRVAVGRVAGCTSPRGYIVIRVAGKLYAAHRLAWAFVHGALPEHDIDHVDGNRANNRISNLRLAPQVLNQQNRKRANRTSASGLLGVSFDKRRGTWKAEIQAHKKRNFLGNFPSAEDAHAAYLVAKRRLHEFGTL